MVLLNGGSTPCSPPHGWVWGCERRPLGSLFLLQKFCSPAPKSSFSAVPPAPAQVAPPVCAGGYSAPCHSPHHLSCPTSFRGPEWSLLPPSLSSLALLLHPSPHSHSHGQDLGLSPSITIPSLPRARRHLLPVRLPPWYPDSTRLPLTPRTSCLLPCTRPHAPTPLTAPRQTQPWLTPTHWLPLAPVWPVCWREAQPCPQFKFTATDPVAPLTLLALLPRFRATTTSHLLLSPLGPHPHPWLMTWLPFTEKLEAPTTETSSFHEVISPPCPLPCP